MPQRKLSPALFIYLYILMILCIVSAAGAALCTDRSIIYVRILRLFPEVYQGRA